MCTNFHVIWCKDLHIRSTSKYIIGYGDGFLTEGSQEITKGENYELKMREIMEVQHYIIQVIEERRLRGLVILRGW